MVGNNNYCSKNKNNLIKIKIIENNYCSICPEELELGKKSSYVRFLDFDIKIKDIKFQIGLFYKRLIFFCYYQNAS